MQVLDTRIKGCKRGMGFFCAWTSKNRIVLVSQWATTTTTITATTTTITYTSNITPPTTTTTTTTATTISFPQGGLL